MVNTCLWLPHPAARHKWARHARRRELSGASLPWQLSVGHLCDAPWYSSHCCRISRISSGRLPRIVMASPIVTCGGATVRDTHGSNVSHGLRQPEALRGAGHIGPVCCRCSPTPWVPVGLFWKQGLDGRPARAKRLIFAILTGLRFRHLGGDRELRREDGVDSL